MHRILAVLAASSLAATAAAAPAGHGFDGRRLESASVDRAVNDLMRRAKIPGVALAIIDGGRLSYVQAYGYADMAARRPLRTDTVMYGASLTKAAFAYMVAQLADEGAIDLDASISRYLKRPLADYPRYKALAGDERWRALTPRILLGHASGFANFAYLEPDQALRFHFDPGTRYAYSGEGMNLLQFVLEEGLGLDVGAEMQRRVFAPFGMTRTSMTWRADFAGNVATGYDADLKPEPHDERSHVRAAGSMDTTITDYARFLAAASRGDRLSRKARRELSRPVVAIASAHQFPTLAPGQDPANARLGLASDLGRVQFATRYGLAEMKGGHDDVTDNTSVCIGRRCLLVMTNSGVGARLFPTLFATIMSDPGVPWGWEYNPPLRLEP